MSLLSSVGNAFHGSNFSLSASSMSVPHGTSHVLENTDKTLLVVLSASSSSSISLDVRVPGARFTETVFARGFSTFFAGVFLADDVFFCIEACFCGRVVFFDTDALLLDAGSRLAGAFFAGARFAGTFFAAGFLVETFCFGVIFRISVKRKSKVRMNRRSFPRRKEEKKKVLYKVWLLGE